MARNTRLDFRRWTWRSFVATTLAPMLVIEVVLLGAYGMMTLWNHQNSVSSVHELAQRQLSDRAAAEARAIRGQLLGIEHQARTMERQAIRALQRPHGLPESVRSQYVDRGDGAWILKDPPPGSASLFYSGRFPIDAAAKDKAWRTARLDPLLADTVEQYPMVVQSYFTTWDTLGRIYPPVEVDAFPAGFDVRETTFYAPAAEVNNPSREVVWTDAYLDPAGAGWIISALAPVYIDDRMEGVLGLDVSLRGLIDAVLEVRVPWDGYAVLVSEDGALLALPPSGEEDFGAMAVQAGRLDGRFEAQPITPDEYALFERDGTRGLAAALAGGASGIAEVDLNGDRMVAWQKIAGPDWYVVLIVPSASMDAPADQMWAFSVQLGAGVLACVIVFYIGFLVVLYRRSRRQAALVVEPLQQLREVMADIVAGELDPPAVHSQVWEIDAIAQDALSMGRTLAEQKRRQLAEKQSELEAASEREAEAIAANAAKTAFLARVSHEIRTPMNGVLGTLELMSDEGLDPEQAESVRVARRSAATLLTLIDDLLDAARAQRGDFEVERVRFDLDAVVSDVAAVFTPTAAARGLSLHVEKDLGRAGAMGDPTRLRQVLTNLLSNALKFTEQGQVVLRAVREGEIVRFEVEDTGVGIPEDRLEAIFDAFTQADVSTTRRFGGTGLGLTISAALVVRMGGVLRVDSRLGEGSRFHFDLSLSACSVPDAPEVADSDRAAVSLRILVAEDHPTNQVIIRRMLERLGHRPVVVPDGVRAVEAVSEGGFDAVILDVHMPRMDGREAARRLRRDPRLAGLPILGLTASVMADELEQCREAGMDEVLSKPTSLDRLQAALSNISDRIENMGPVRRII